MKKQTSKYIYDEVVGLYIDGEYYGDVEQVEVFIESAPLYSSSSMTASVTIKTQYIIKVKNKPKIVTSKFMVQKGLHKATKIFINSKQDTFIPNKDFYYVLPFYKKGRYSAKEFVAECDEYWEFKSKVDKVKKPKQPYGPQKLPSSNMDPAVKALPALEEKVKNPVTGLQGRLQDVIISLNDSSKWTREQIADWLETLDIDIRFGVKK